MTNKEIKQDKAIVINKIIRGVKDCEHKLVIAKLYSEDGKELGTQTITMKDKLKLDKELNLIRKPKTPYNLFTRNKDIARQYLINLTPTEKGYLLDLMYNIDALGRVKYGDNVSQYCRNYSDLAKVLNIAYDTLRRNLIPKLKANNIIRIVTVDKNIYRTSYISFNPILVVGGGYWDRWEVIIWYDELMKYNLLSMKKIKKITGLTEKQILEEKERLTSILK